MTLSPSANGQRPTTNDRSFPRFRRSPRRRWRFPPRQRKIRSERLELAADSARHLRATARAAVRVAGFELAGALTEGRRMSVGGAATSIEPASLFIARVIDPALDRDALFGRYR